MPRYLFLALALVTCLEASAQNRRYSQEDASGGVLLPEEAAYDVKAYDLALRVDPEEKTIDGTLTMDAELLAATEFVVMDLDPRLEVDALSWTSTDTRSEAHERRGRQLWIPAEGLEPGARFQVVIAYGGKPREAPRPPWDGGFTWSRTADGSPWIATTCQGEGADVWWPCKDHPSDEPDQMDLRITAPADLVVATNGRLVSVEDSAEEGWRTHNWHVSTPINNYGVALNIAPYRTITTDFESVAGDSFEFTYWVLPENYEKGVAIFEEFQRQMRFFEEFFGPYPFRGDKYGVAETPHLGMEHQSIIAYGHQYRGDPDLGYDYDWLHHHELSHEWWANLVTARDWNDFWIHEGIGTYTQALYLEQRFGEEAYRKKLASDLKRVKNRGTVAPRDPRTTQEMYFSSNREDAPDIDVYMKGSWICHSLRWVVGDDRFFEILRRWAYPDPALEGTTDGSACRFATTDELIEIAEEIAGIELDWFFELYLRQPGLPELVVTPAEGGLELAWKTPNSLVFPMPVEVRILGQVVRVPMPGGRGWIGTGDEEATEWEIDPLHRILMAR